MIEVALTTDRFAVAAPSFSQLGLEPVWLPCIRVESAADEVLVRARQAASAADLLVISSARTLELVWPDGSLPAVDVAAVGERTAGAVAARGGRVVVQGRSGLADLTKQLVERPASRRVAFPHAAGSSPAAVAALRAWATEFWEFQVYRTVPMAPGPGRVTAVAFASPSAVQGWLLSRDLNGLVVGVIGSTTGEAVAEHRPPDVIAPQPSYQSLARSLASALEVTV